MSIKIEHKQETVDGILKKESFTLINSAEPDVFGKVYEDDDKYMFFSKPGLLSLKEKLDEVISKLK